MITYKFPPTGKTLYGLTTGTAYESLADFSWKANGAYFSLNSIAEAEPDGVTDVRPFNVGDTVSSAEELDALPDETILRDESGARQKLGGLFYSIADEVPITSTALAFDNMLTILWLPETGGQA